MATLKEVYKCEKCGNIVEVLHGGKGALVCCGEEMKLFAENTVDAAQEKHVPVVEKFDGGYKVTVGSVAHPMVDNHYIEWIELLTEDRVYRKHLNAGDTPEALFLCKAQTVKARAYCNLHGLWQS